MQNSYAEPFDLVMNEDRNPLMRLPKVTRFQVMVVLSVMWSTIFCVAFGSFFWWGEMVVGHMAILTGILVTSLTFRGAARRVHRHPRRGRPMMRRVLPGPSENAPSLGSPAVPSLPTDIGSVPTLVLRPLGQSDACHILRHFRDFDAADRYSRFFSSKSDAGLQNFVESFDWDRMLAIGAFDGDRLVGVAELGWEQDDEGSLAELAFSVSPEWRHRGIGTWVTRHLCALACEVGVRRIYAIWIGENTPAYRIMRSLGARIGRDGKVMRGEVDIGGGT